MKLTVKYNLDVFLSYKSIKKNMKIVFKGNVNQKWELVTIKIDKNI